MDHINYAVRTGKTGISNGFEDIRLINASLPGLRLGDIDTTCAFLGKKLKVPLLINAMTGGHPGVKEVNRCLAGVARDFGIAMAVGSQRAGLENTGVRDTYSVAREQNPDGVLLANLDAGATPEQAASAVEMISADGLQLYLNVPQELAMPEGDRDFRGIIANIRDVASSLSVPVIVKEVGFGLSRESVAAVYEAGARYVDVGGHGGTNFVAIEDLRSGKKSPEGILNWGIPTAASLLEALSLGLSIIPIASGGLSSGMDVARAIALGAGMAGIAGLFLRALLEGSEEALRGLVADILGELRLAMLMAGAENLSRLAEKPVLVTGATAEWLERRGIDINRYARR